MYKELLSRTWEDIMEADYIFKSNTGKHVIELPASSIGLSDDSIILIYYNVYTGEPMILMHHMHYDVDVKYPEIEGYTVSCVDGVEKDGSKYKEITYVCKALI